MDIHSWLVYCVELCRTNYATYENQRTINPVNMGKILKKDEKWEYKIPYFSSLVFLFHPTIFLINAQITSATLQIQVKVFSQVCMVDFPVLI